MKRFIVGGLALAFFVGTIALPGKASAVPAAQENTGCGLGAMLMAELGDEAGFALLVELALGAGQPGLVRELEAAQVDERRHFETLRGWVSAHARGDEARRAA